MQGFKTMLNKRKKISPFLEQSHTDQKMPASWAELSCQYYLASRAHSPGWG